jgi:DNA-binding CsgD family transcriptional regulator
MTRGAAVLVDSVVARIEELLAGGASEAEVAKKLELKLNTLQKAIRAGRIRIPLKKSARWSAFSREHQKRAH